MLYITFGLRLWEIIYPDEEIKVSIKVISNDLIRENLTSARRELESSHIVLLTNTLKDDKRNVELMKEYFEINLAVTLGVPELDKDLGELYCADPVVLLEEKNDAVYVVEFPTWKSKEWWSIFRIQLS